MPEYEQMRRLDKFPNVLMSWTTPKVRGPAAFDLLTRLFKYDPDKRITAKEALAHKWFQEDPKPNRKCGQPYFF